jgi:hypothetical protein
VRLARLLVRIAEIETGMTWGTIHAEMDRLYLGEFYNKDVLFSEHESHQKAA